MSSPEWKLIEAGSLLAQFETFGLIWLNADLSVEDTFGPLVSFVGVGKPVTDSILAFIGLEQEIRSLRETTTRVLELPAVSVFTHDNPTAKLNFTIFWNAGRDCAMALAYKSAAQTELEIELSRQIRARLMAEAAVTAKSKELARANIDLESFAAIVSHDLKAPLRHMRQMTEAAFDHVGIDDAQAVRNSLRAIETQSRRMSDMLTALLDYSTLGRKYEAIESVDTRQLVEVIGRSLPETRHRMSIQGSWPKVSTLRAPLDLVLRNLIANAIQHHDQPSGEIVVSCADDAQNLVFQVADDGPGIDPKHHDTIFLPFRTLKDSEQSSSTGMGLAAVRKTIDAARGSISIASDPATARGTTFSVYWPKSIGD